MTMLIVDIRTPDGTRTFEILVTYGEEVTLAETCIERCGTSREWRDTRSMLLLIGRKPGVPA
jgi:hypothetical protein